jgi:hypothetical protein
MWLPLGLALLFVLLVFAGFHLTRATTLTIAVAPNGGTEPTLLRAYADELARGSSPSASRSSRSAGCARAPRR